MGGVMKNCMNRRKNNLQVRLALGLHNLNEDIFTERTIYNFRFRGLKYIFAFIKDTVNFSASTCTLLAQIGFFTGANIQP